MKLSLFTLVLNDRPVEEAISLLAEIGYDGIELQGKAPHLPMDTTAERAREIRKRIEDAGLVIPVLATYTGGYSTKSDAECREQIDALQRFMEIGDALGCKMIRHASGGPSPKVAEPQHWERSAEWMRKAADIAAGGGFRLVMEIHFGALAEDADSSLKLLKMVDRPNVGVIHDAGNMYIARADFGPESVHKLGKHIFHVHVKDEQEVSDLSVENSFASGDRFIAHKLLNHGAVDHAPTIRALAEIGYDGFLSAECHGSTLNREMVARHEYIAMKEMLPR